MPRIRFVLFAALLSLFLGGLAWGVLVTSPARPSSGRGPEASLQRAGISYKLRLDRGLYQANQPLQIEFSVVNNRKNAANFASTRQPSGPVFSILQGKKLYWSWPAVEDRSGQPREEWFGPGLTKIYRVTCQPGASGPSLPAGSYTLLATFPPTKDLGKFGLTELKVEFAVGERIVVQAQNPAGLQVRLLTDKTAYAVGEPVAMQLVIKNTGATPQTFHSGSSQRFDFTVSAGDQEIWRWSKDRMFAQMMSSWQLAPGETLTYNAAWEQKDNAGKAAPAGSYTITGKQISGGQATGIISIK